MGVQKRQDQRVVELQAPHKSKEKPGGYMSTAEIYGSGRREHATAWGPATAEPGQKYRTENTLKY